MAYTVKRFTLDASKDLPIHLIRSSLEVACHNEIHTHSVLEFAMIVSGVGEYRVEQQVYPVVAGDIVLFNNTERHGLWNTGDTPLVNLSLEFEPHFVWENLPYLFDPALLGAFFRRGKDFSHKLDSHHPATGSLRQQFDTVWALFENPPPHADVLVHIRLLNMLADVLRIYPEEAASPTRFRPPADMEQVLRYIRQHYAEPISLSTLAAIVNMNKTYFSQVFRECNGMGPKEYIVKTRIAAAARLLRDSDRTILDIAGACGFNSPSNFYNAFQRITGQTPVHYRQHPFE